MSGGGGGGSQQTTSTGTTYSSNLPEYAKPYYEELLKQGGKQVYTTNPGGYVTGVKSQVPYRRDRLAGFTPQQKALQAQVARINPTAPGFLSGTNALDRASTRADVAMRGIDRASGYTPDTITSDDVGGPLVSDVFRGEDVGAPSDISATQVNETVTTDRFTDPGMAANYMNPYQQQVVDVQTQEARRQADIAKSGRGLGSISRGTFGGGRQALMEAEADRALATQLGAIQATGSQQAYQQGQQAFTQDQARGLQMQQANQGADLQAQQLRQAGQKANQATRIQTDLANQAADLKAQQLRQESQKANQATYLQADIANQAADLKAQGMQQAGDQFGADLDKQLGLAGIQAQSAIGGQYAQIAANERMTELKTLVAQSTDAEEIQRLNQEMLSLEYQQFREKQDYEKQQVQFMSDILRGNAGALGSTDVQYAAAPSLASQIGGGVAGIAGLYGALSGGG